MQVKLNGCMVQLLVILLFPIVLVIRFFGWITGSNKTPEYTNTIDDHPLEYAGKRPLVISLWATWASIWPYTEKAVDQMKEEFGEDCEFCYVEVTGNDVRKQYKLENEPTVIVRHRGREVARFVNMMVADELRVAIAECLSRKE